MSMETVSFATSRRGGLTMAEIREIEAHRCRDRPTPWQALANRYGRPVEDIRAVLHASRPEEPPVENPDKPFVWDARSLHMLNVLFGEMKLEADMVAKAIGCTPEAVRGKARRLGISALSTASDNSSTQIEHDDQSTGRKAA